MLSKREKLLLKFNDKHVVDSESLDDSDISSSGGIDFKQKDRNELRSKI